MNDRSQDLRQLFKYNVKTAQGQGIHIGDHIYQEASAEAIVSSLRSALKELADTPQADIPALKPTNDIVATVRSQWILSSD